MTAAADATSYLVTGLHPYEYYQLSVFASTRIGRSPASMVTIMTEEASKLFYYMYFAKSQGWAPLEVTAIRLDKAGSV